MLYPLYNEEILHHIKRGSCKQEQVDLYINDECAVQPDLSSASRSQLILLWGKNVGF